jgi:hypothetical protein
VLTSLAFTGQGGRALQRHATYACLELSPKSAPLNAEYSGIPRCLPIYACSKDQRAANSSASTVVSRRQISVFPDPRPSCESASVSGTYLTPKRDFSVTVPSSLLSTRMISCCIARWCVFRLVTHKKLDYTEFQGDLDRKNPTRNWSTQKFKGSQTEKASPHKHPQSACTKSGRVDEGTKSIQHTGFTNLRFDTDWNHHSAPWLELLDQRGRDGRSGSTDMDCIVWSRLRESLSAVTLRDMYHGPGRVAGDLDTRAPGTQACPCEEWCGKEGTHLRVPRFWSASMF